MNNTIYIDPVTKVCDSFRKEYKPEHKKKRGSAFLDKMLEKKEEKAGLSVAEGETGAVKDMTMEEYKSYIHNIISNIPMHPTRTGESIFIVISDEGFEAMKNDPEYEAWVLNDLRNGWAQADPWAEICGGAFSTIYYGAEKEDCRVEVWRGDAQRRTSEEEHGTCFWEQRMERRKQLQAQYEKFLEKKALFIKKQKELYYEKEAVIKMEQSRNPDFVCSENKTFITESAYDASILLAAMRQADG